jgi:DNA modification methylase
MATAEMDAIGIARPPRPLSGLVRADARRLPLADRSVHCVATSIPYWGLRDYGLADQIGMEPTPACYVRAIVAAFGEVWRVLRDDGTLWLNCGDTYVTKPMGKGTTFDPKYPGGRNRKEGLRANRSNRPGDMGLKHKDLVGVPWRVALALQEAGWYLRCDVVWHKPNAYCESVRDRPARCHEYLFLLTKRPRYYYDYLAIVEPTAGTAHSRGKGVNPKAKQAGRNSRTNVDRDSRHAAVAGSRQDASSAAAVTDTVPFRNKRTVWTIPTSAFPGAHFATYPFGLVEPCILAGTSAAGVCPACGKGWRRVVERPTHPREGEVLASARDGGLTAQDGLERTGLSHCKYDEWLKANPPRTVGWEPACRCDAGDPVPPIVLDPFNGAGTTGLVAAALGRAYVGVDLSADYLAMSRARLDAAADAPPARPRKRRRPPRPEQRSLFPDEP